MGAEGLAIVCNTLFYFAPKWVEGPFGLFELKTILAKHCPQALIPFLLQ